MNDNVIIHDNSFLSSLLTTPSASPSPSPSRSLIYSVLLLNGACAVDSLFHALWQNASKRMCADGGANVLYEYTKQLSTENTPPSSSPSPSSSSSSFPLPCLILGDLDSIRPDVRDYYENKQVNVQQVNDENTTDLDKCLLACSPSSSPDFPPLLLVLGAFGGRFDSQLSNIHSLYSHAHRYERILFLSDGNLVEYICPGVHELRLCPAFEEPAATHCGLVPLMGPVKQVTTQGLKWNLHQQEMRWGSLISTNNIITDRIVRISCDGPLVWTTEFKDTRKK